jgi:large subunit ribosomal protein L10
MSKQIKQLEMDALKKTFQGVRDMVLLSASGVNAQANNQLRQTLRKKNIHLQVVKNSLTRRVFDELGMKIATWEGPTLLAWGAGSLAELSRELDTLLKKNDKIKAKTALAEGQEVPFQTALTMPTRAEASGRVVGLALSPARRLVSQILAPGSQLLSQIMTLRDKAEEGPAAEGVAPQAAG